MTKVAYGPSSQSHSPNPSIAKNHLLELEAPAIVSAHPTGHKPITQLDDQKVSTAVTRVAYGPTINPFLSANQIAKIIQYKHQSMAFMPRMGMHVSIILTV